ncbi:hypothetical protein GF1_11660 [Desulfolithobacter dissulfuricans]|uniref:Antitoxin SocA-like Panacea domain-containing protein n=1 Tax=Desulfolithobacter dissulfuricans TaxID=2795293 RepID=A0A915U0Z1_9BACT|nr:type II toxin-antitoxin system antitoxin SocA domain-containing protein [Desulfolithobacter dissulfuricans]BCO08790.1 hypothetical protein GF1_11660 [Desulfolithobacter dissulfuricans]
MNPLELAKFILATYPDKHITPMKLQKLAYYAKVWSLVAGEPFIKAQFVKWAYGPVNQAIYTAFKKYGADPIPSKGIAVNIDQPKEKLLQFILDNYADYSAFALSAMTHSEKPWKETPDNAVITDEAIVAYYSQKPFAKNFTQDYPGKPFYVLQSNTWHSFTLDMDKNEAESFAVYSSYEEFKKLANAAAIDFKNLLDGLSVTA